MVAGLAEVLVDNDHVRRFHSHWGQGVLVALCCETSELSEAHNFPGKFLLDARWGEGGSEGWKKAAGWLPTASWAGPPPPSGEGWGPPCERP